MASISEPFIRRPVGTTLLAIRVLSGRHRRLHFPAVGLGRSQCRFSDDPGFRATRPGRGSVRNGVDGLQPRWKRRLGEIAGIDQITSTSSLGTTSIQLQFGIGRNIDRAARDVQAAINASLADLPSDLPSLPEIPARPTRRRRRSSCWR